VQGELSRLEPRDGYIDAGTVSVPYSSIDLNGHVNNTEYVRWGIDAIVRMFKPLETVRSVQTTYLSEVFEGEELDLLISSDQSGSFHVLGRRSRAESAVFLMEVGCPADGGGA